MSSGEILGAVKGLHWLAFVMSDNKSCVTQAAFATSAGVGAPSVARTANSPPTMAAMQIRRLASESCSRGVCIIATAMASPSLLSHILFELNCHGLPFRSRNRACRKSRCGFVTKPRSVARPSSASRVSCKESIVARRQSPFDIALAFAMGSCRHWYNRTMVSAAT